MSSPGILTLILLFVSLHIAVIAEDKHMLCKTVDDIFTVDSVGRSQQITRRLQGPPGKLGPKGPKGDSGPPGPRGQIGRPGADNNQRIDQVEARVAARMDELEREFQMKIDKLNATVWQSTSIKERLCNGMYYRGYCYWAIIPTSQAMNYNEAVQNCSDGSGEPADIVDSMHYNMIFEYVRSLTSLSHTLLWLGTTINPKTEIVSLSNGSRASYVKYDKGFPSSISSWTQMAINVDQDLLRTNQRMWNTNPAYYIHGVLCQK